jgi:hypothetical protein
VPSAASSAGAAAADDTPRVYTNHGIWRELYPDSVVPLFGIADEGPGHWVVTYESERRMCRLAEGLLLGFSDTRNISTTVTHLSCSNQGDDACILDVVVA